MHVMIEFQYRNNHSIAGKMKFFFLNIFSGHQSLESTISIWLLLVVQLWTLSASSCRFHNIRSFFILIYQKVTKWLQFILNWIFAVIKRMESEDLLIEFSMQFGANIMQICIVSVHIPITLWAIAKPYCIVSGNLLKQFQFLLTDEKFMHSKLVIQEKSHLMCNADS